MSAANIQELVTNNSAHLDVYMLSEERRRRTRPVLPWDHLVRGGVRGGEDTPYVNSTQHPDSVVLRLYHASESPGDCEHTKAGPTPEILIHQQVWDGVRESAF